MSERIALGFCNNVDYEIVWSRAVLEDLVIHYQIRPYELQTRRQIQSERDLLVSILGFMRRAEGGERFVLDSALIERFAARFEKNITLGGTSVRAAIAMRKLGHRSALHLITQNDHVRRLIPSDSPYVCSNASDSVYPHLIVQFGAGDRICAGEIDIRARRPNRLIFHCNADRIAMRLAPDFADLIVDAEVLLISGFNAMQDQRLLEKRLATVSLMLAQLPGGAKVFLEDGGYFDPRFRQELYRTLGRRVNVYSMNEDELQEHLKRRIELSDAAQVRTALDELHRIIPAAAIVLHTEHWALAHGAGASEFAGALKAGVTMATTRFRYGDGFTVANYREIENRAPSSENAEFAMAINSMGGGDLYCVPVAEVEQAKATTIGLGDAFVGGFLPALLS
ncbi:MAG: hypothetical protein OXG68_19400 [Chloroflexi bacterium]|nr:hypothetical protein [Chloroflexota bacterium]